MLSYLKDKADSGLSLIKSGLQGNSSNGTQPSTSGSEDYLSPAEHGKNLKQSSMTLGILIAIAVACLWFMIKKAAPQSTSAAVNNQEVEIEKAIAQITGIRSEVNNQVDNILGRFHGNSNVDQIEVGDLKKNPFKHEMALIDIIDEEQNASIAREVFRAELLNKANSLQLLSIMESPQGNCCMINDRIVYTGDKIEGFTVTAVSDDAVELSLEGTKIKLKISE